MGGRFVFIFDLLSYVLFMICSFYFCTILFYLYFSFIIYISAFSFFFRLSFLLTIGLTLNHMEMCNNQFDIESEENREKQTCKTIIVKLANVMAQNAMVPIIEVIIVVMVPNVMVQK